VLEKKKDLSIIRSREGGHGYRTTG
jgi:hypothetical protein